MAIIWLTDRHETGKPIRAVSVHSTETDLRTTRYHQFIKVFSDPDDAAAFLGGTNHPGRWSATIDDLGLMIPGTWGQFHGQEIQVFCKFRRYRSDPGIEDVGDADRIRARAESGHH